MQMNPARLLGDMKIGTRLALSYAAILLLLMVAIAYTSYSMVESNKQSAAALEELNFKQEFASDVSASLNTIIISIHSILLTPNDTALVAAERKQIDEARQKYGNALTQMVAFNDTEEGTNLLQKLEDSIDKAKLVNNQVLALAEQGKREAAVELQVSQSRVTEEEPLKAVVEYARHQKQKGDETKLLVAQQAQKTLFTTGALSVAVLLLAVAAAFLITRSITLPLGALQKAIGDVRQGASLDALAMIGTKDEMSDMGFAVNQMLQEQISGREKADQVRQIVEAENESLNNSVIALLQAVNQLSQKDLTARVPLSGDIIDTVADSINQLTDETAKVLHGVNLIASQVAQVSGQVRVQGDLVAVTSQEERENVDEMMMSLDESAKTMDQIADLTNKSNQSAERASQATSTALDTVNSTVKGMESIRETIAETEKRIKRLGERSQEISGIVNLINTISERTHVLALNASMQAAVAGEAGRGFAVVAEEVQRLAESSRNATQQIGTLVNNIQLETNEAISTVNRTIGQVVQGSEQAQKAGEHMRLTQEITGELVAQVQTIAQAYGLQKKMSDSLLESVQRLGKSNERTAQQIDTQGRETQTLIDSARQLVESVNVFKLPKLA